VAHIPAPQGDADAPLQALVFDSHFDPYRGIIAYVRLRQGRLAKGMRIRMMATGKEFEVDEVGVFGLTMKPVESLVAGEVGYVAAGIKVIGDARVGDTITQADHPAATALAGYRALKPMVFCGLYPTEGDDYSPLREALERLQLNDAALSYEPETSAALGFGFRCGFLGLLHMDIVQERLEREYGLSLVATAPSVVYRIHRTDGEVVEIDNPARMPEPQHLDFIEEPWVKATIMAPAEYVGPCLELAQERRGEFRNIEYSSTNRVIITYNLPLAEILLDFFDQLKSRTRGYASLDYDFAGYRPGELVRVQLLVNGDPVDALSFVTHRERSQSRARRAVEKLKQVVPRQLFEVRLQAAINSRIIAAETVRPLRKNVLAKCYGGDVTRKRKLLERQKAGKKRMKQIGSVEIPQEAFLTVLRLGDERE
jgi:GTP-binding protein LepA